MPDVAARRTGRVRELLSLAYVMARFWPSIFPLVRSVLHELERDACAIPDPVLRAHALETLRGEGLSAMGAALVATTVDRTDPTLVRLLVSLQVAWDYVDTLAEQPAADPLASGMQLHRALVDAISPTPPRADYYLLHSAHDDGGYLLALVERCRAACASLPAFPHVAPAAGEGLARAAIQYAHHAPPARREAALQEWAAEQQGSAEASWFELAAAASSSLGVLAILALAADPATDEYLVERVHAAYAPWVDALTALLDSLVDRPDDARAGLANWIDHYPSDAAAGVRLEAIACRAFGEVRALPRGGRHAVIVAGMVAMHCSQSTAWLPGVRPTTRAVMRASGSAALPLLLALLRAWRWARARGDGDEGDQAVRPTGQLTPVPPRPQ
ncbi:MAG TPA: DUF2600 family protein [Conexibacter sp.]|nr:DUF2600 family protein [Conexibacter sp.]